MTLSSQDAPSILLTISKFQAYYSPVPSNSSCSHNNCSQKHPHAQSYFQSFIQISNFSQHITKEEILYAEALMPLKIRDPQHLVSHKKMFSLTESLSKWEHCVMNICMFKWLGAEKKKHLMTKTKTKFILCCKLYELQRKKKWRKKKSSTLLCWTLRTRF